MANFKLLLLLFLITSTSIYAQTFEGIVLDNHNRPLEAAYINNLQNDEHAHSDSKGLFTFHTISIGDSIQVSYLGFADKVVAVKALDQLMTIVLEESIISLDAVVISPKTTAANVISTIDLQVNPVNSSQDILRQVPGLFIGQHAGGGKAEQIFLRGFDIDHGTDINITVDGMPVNMVSHAHGQGYADLHFVIPETVDKIDFGKGAYYADKGNFATAGYVDFRTKEVLDNSLLKIEAGQFNTQRIVSMLNVLDNEKGSAYIAAEHLSTDGAFESPQNFNRINVLGKYTAYLPNNNKLSVIASTFSSKWDASGQVPQRAIDDGSITRFGAIDDTEGGETGRTNILAAYTKFINDQSFVKSTVFYSNYDFELYSNFTFFLDDPINGDQIKQKEVRDIYGINTEYNRTYSNNDWSIDWQAGINLRSDQSRDNELSHTLNRTETLSFTQLGEINETNVGTYLNASIYYGKWTINPSVRLDYFNFNYNDALQTAYATQSKTAALISPKLHLAYRPSDDVQIYFKAGKGFHSNDTRVVVTENDKQTLPSSYGTDIGFIWKPLPKLVINTALWHLFLEQEFVYVGDAGIVEPSGKTNRQGIDFSLRYQPFQWLFWNLDANYTKPRSTDDPEGENFIPLAPDFTLASGLNMLHQSGFYGGLHVRHLKNRPANEDNSIVAEGYTIVDLNAGFQWNNLDIGFQIQNLLDAEWNETQFATESRLQNEIDSVEEIHFTPGAPFFIKGVISYKF